MIGVRMIKVDGQDIFQQGERCQLDGIIRIMGSKLILLVDVVVVGIVVATSARFSCSNS
jgi:hypothetical protein